MKKSELVKIAIEVDKNAKRVYYKDNTLTYNGITVEANTSTFDKMAEEIKKHFNLEEFTYYIERA